MIIIAISQSVSDPSPSVTCVTSTYMYLRYSKDYQIQLQVCTIKFNVSEIFHRAPPGKKLLVCNIDQL